MKTISYNSVKLNNEIAELEVLYNIDITTYASSRYGNVIAIHDYMGKKKEYINIYDLMGCVYDFLNNK